MLIKRICLVKRDGSSILQAKSIRTSLQRLEIGILRVLTYESRVCWDITSHAADIMCHAADIVSHASYIVSHSSDIVSHSSDIRAISDI